MSEVLMELRDVSRIYGEGDAAVYALDRVSLSVFAGDFISIVGPSGA